VSLALYLQGLRARFDALALRAPVPRPDEAARLAGQAATAKRLLAWCHHDAGPAQAALAPPGARPAADQRLAVGALRCAGIGDPHALIAWADAFARRIDGGTQLDALPGRAAGLAFRLRVKCHDAMAWRARQPTDPWDAGWVINTPAALARLRTGWTPRRATLLLADVHDADALHAGLAALRQRQGGFRHPVRWLWVGGEVDLPAPPGLAVQRFRLD
jgi:hypothetical protein